MKSKLTLLFTCCMLNLAISYGQTKSSAWLLKGNSDTDSSKNFIGTTDAKPLVFKVNNQKAGYLDYDSIRGNTGFGYKALFTEDKYKALKPYYGNFNTAMGYQSLYFNRLGSGNTGVGYQALYNNAKGRANTAIGYQALVNNWGGGSNTGNGAGALFSNTEGDDNTANGSGALYSNNWGKVNTANGTGALSANTIGSANTASGSGALNSNTTGNTNTAIGYWSLSYNTTGHKNTALGAGANVTHGDFTKATAIGADAVVDASYKVLIGSHSVKSIGGQVGWTSFSDERVKKDVKENVPGLSFITALRPVTYHFSVDKEDELIGVKEQSKKAMNPIANLHIQEMNEQDEKDFSNADLPEDNKDEGKYDIEKIQFTGLIAQEVDAVAKKLNYDFSGVDKTGKIWGLRYGDFVVPLVKAVQELSKMNDEKDEAINGLKSEIRNLRSEMDELKSILISQSHSTPNLKPQTTSLSSASLGQNRPNPFNKSTTISYTLPQKFSNAFIKITDENGKTLKQVRVSGMGKGTVNIDAATLTSGVYNYSLYIDGKLIATKQMALTR